LNDQEGKQKEIEINTKIKLGKRKLRKRRNSDPRKEREFMNLRSFSRSSC
jgi:hypothetical protein